jgi:DNA (cytosine-5)-methyltransferase 1
MLRRTLKFGSLFAGVGGLDLGLERAGHRCAWQVEWDAYCRSVLSLHFPTVPKFSDVREVGAHNLAAVDMICGGFPCQDISSAGRRAGIKEGTRSGLWSEFHRIICELRPPYVLVENVEALRHRGRGLGRVLGDLAASGFDAEWDVLPAGAFGAPHLRERLFLFAWNRQTADAGRERRPDAVRASLFGGVPRKEFEGWQPADTLERVAVVGATYPQLPEHLRVFDGIPARLDVPGLKPKERRELMATVPHGAQRVKACGNAVAPPVAEHVGRSISKWLQ